MAATGQKSIWIGAVSIVLLFYFFVNPVSSSWMPQCVFHKLTGLQCMGCGAQRMLHALLHGNVAEAFHANAFLLLSLPLLAFMVWVELSRHRHPELYVRIHSLTVIISVACVLALWFIIRNVIGI